MTHTPNSIAELARAALAWDGVPTIPEGHGEMAWLRYREATRDPATILALCERLEFYASELDGSEIARGMLEARFRTEAMTTPLTPTTPRAGGSELQ